MWCMCFFCTNILCTLLYYFFQTHILPLSCMYKLHTEEASLYPPHSLVNTFCISLLYCLPASLYEVLLAGYNVPV